MKKLNSIIKITTGLFFMALITSCEKEYVPVPAPPVGDISYSSDIQPFWDNDCIGCHPAVFKPDLTAGNSYDALLAGNYIDTANPTNSLIYTKIITGGSMNTYVSNAGNIQKTLLWIEQGAKNN